MVAERSSELKPDSTCKPMAVPKVCGLETEYGILVRGADNNPVTASALLINAYTGVAQEQVAFDLIAEDPQRDARSPDPLDPYEFDPELEYAPVNAVLTNGARYYVDHAHPEMSTPEVRTPREAVIWDRAGEEIIRQSMAAAQRLVPDGAEILIHKNNSDGKGNSYGCHENYLVDRGLPFGKVISAVMAHFVTRQVFAGAGKVGCELPGMPSDSMPFQLSQRADFFEEEVGLETTVRRPIVNTRDEPHCDASKYRRLHVIAGDANMSEVATFLKVASTAMLLAAVEDEPTMELPALANPVRAITQISHDPTLSAVVSTYEGTTVRALDVQWQLFEIARSWVERTGGEAVGEADCALALQHWEHILSGLESNPLTVADRVDWVAKQRLINAYAERHNVVPGSAALRAIDLQYHDMRPSKGLASRCGLVTLVDDDEVQRATTQPPTSTRAYFRGRCVERYGNDIIAANWDSMVFDIGADPLRRVPMDDPLRGTAELVANVIDNSATAVDLVAALAEPIG